jgi:hypothetical protein
MLFLWSRDVSTLHGCCHTRDHCWNSDGIALRLHNKVSPSSTSARLSSAQVQGGLIPTDVTFWCQASVHFLPSVPASCIQPSDSRRKSARLCLLPVAQPERFSPPNRPTPAGGVVERWSLQRLGRCPGSRPSTSKPWWGPLREP